MTYIRLAKQYELDYWNAHKNEKYSRVDIMLKMFPNLKGHEVVADIGCGPYCGIFSRLKFSKMFAVDPLWDEYKRNKLMKVPPNVIVVKEEGESFTLTTPADLIVSFNAIDHSGNLRGSISNIMKNLVVGGRFCFHVHMRTKSQMNKGHRMLVTEDLLDSILSDFKVVSKSVGKDPFVVRGGYTTYIAEVKHG